MLNTRLVSRSHPDEETFHIRLDHRHVFKFCKVHRHMQHAASCFIVEYRNYGIPVKKNVLENKLRKENFKKKANKCS